MSAAVMESTLPLPGHRKGKVRDVYEVKLADGTAAVVLIASDRISAFDVVMPQGVAGKGVVLTQISRFWFDMIARKLGDRIKHHIISYDPATIPGLSSEQIEQLRGRTVIAHKTQVVPIECVVRGYLAGSGWTEYQKSQTVCGVKLPARLKRCDKLPQPIFTPATKEASGHDENIPFERACEIAGQSLMTRLRDWSVDIYRMAHDHAAKHGIILADTKFEFGQLPNGDVLLIDEALTPDSSRFWPADEYEPGRDQASFDKQFLRNYLQELVDEGRWNKDYPGPPLPDKIVEGTLAKYLEAYRLLTGEQLKL